MAGSAGSPPPRITVYVCPECGCESVGHGPCLHSTMEAGKWVERNRPVPMEPVEYVPREQSDALAKVLEIVRTDIRRRLASDDSCEAPFDEDLAEAEQRIDAALNSYREATGGEDGHGD